MKTYAGCFMLAALIGILLAVTLGVVADTPDAPEPGSLASRVFLPLINTPGRECRLVLFEDNSWMSPDYHPSEGWPPDPACTWVLDQACGEVSCDESQDCGK